jgi:hypothetical protein
MRYSGGQRKTRVSIIICVVLFAIVSLPLLSSARSASSVATSVNIQNNSSREIRNVYISHVNADDWSGNQLGTSTIGPGQSFNLSNITCDQQQVKVIAEDGDGCFLSTVVSCGDSATWTISNDTARDCGY